MTDMITLARVTAPVVEPLTIDEVKIQCGLVADDHNELLEGLITAATGYAEDYTQRSLIRQTWDLTLDAFPDGPSIYVPRPPLVDVTWVKYLDAGGALQTWDADNYTVESGNYDTSQQGRISRPVTALWPVTQAIPNAVTIRFRAGYGTTANEVPMVIRLAMKQFIAEAWSLRSNTVVGATASMQHQSTDRLLTQYRSSWL